MSPSHFEVIRIAKGLAVSLPLVPLCQILTALLLRRVRAGVARVWVLGLGLTVLLLVVGVAALALVGPAALDTYSTSVNTAISVGCLSATARVTHYWGPKSP